VLLTGVGPWIDWLQVSRTITWYSHSPNASILGVLARLNGAGGRDFLPLSAIPSTWLIAAAIAALAMIVVSLRCRHPDHRWAAGILMAVAIFPLGWSYYLPLALGPLAGTLRRFSWVAATGAVALALQMPLLPFAGNEGLDFVFVASLGCAATVLLWLAVVYEPETSTS
jgi:hypothetical protein